MNDKDEIYIFSSYYKYDFSYVSKDGTKRMSLNYDLCNANDIYRMSLSLEMSRTTLLYEGFEDVE